MDEKTREILLLKQELDWVKRRMKTNAALAFIRGVVVALAVIALGRAISNIALPDEGKAHESVAVTCPNGSKSHE